MVRLSAGQWSCRPVKRGEREGRGGRGGRNREKEERKEGREREGIERRERRREERQVISKMTADLQVDWYLNVETLHIINTIKGIYNWVTM